MLPEEFHDAVPGGHALQDWKPRVIVANGNDVDASIQRYLPRSSHWRVYLSPSWVKSWSCPQSVLVFGAEELSPIHMDMLSKKGCAPA